MNLCSFCAFVFLYFYMKIACIEIEMLNLHAMNESLETLNLLCVTIFDSALDATNTLSILRSMLLV